MKPIFISTSHGLYHKEKKKKIKNTIGFYIKPQLGVSCKIRNDYADYDYVSKLDKNNLKFLKAFHREYYNADFQHKHSKPLHKTKTLKKKCYSSNNSRNRDVYARAKCQNKLTTYGVDCSALESLTTFNSSEPS